MNYQLPGIIIIDSSEKVIEELCKQHNNYTNTINEVNSHLNKKADTFY